MTIPAEAIQEYLKLTDNACHGIAGVVADKYGLSRDELVAAALDVLPEDEPADMTRPGDVIHDN